MRETPRGDPPAPAALADGRTGWLLVALLTTHAALLGWAALRDSATWDEPGHLAAGLSHWRTGTFHLYRVNPPLVRMTGAAPVALAGARFDDEDPLLAAGPARRPEFAAGERLCNANGERFFRLLTVARWACIPFSLAGALVCFAWARELYGRAAGATAGVLWCFCPNVLGHGHLISPDAAAAALGVAAAYAFWRWLRAPSWRRACGAGVVLGLAELTKSTWVVLFLLWPAAAFVYRRMQPPAARAGARRHVLGVALVLAIALYLLNWGYGFQGSFARLDSYRFVSPALAGPDGAGPSRNRFAGTALGRFPVPLPRDYVEGIDVQRSDFERVQWSFLRGEWRFGGWWHYYLYGLAVKTPVGTCLLLALSLGLWALRRPGYGAAWRDELFLALPCLVVLALVSSQTGFNHHVRYALPLLPFAFVSISKAARAFPLGHRWAAAAVAVALGSAVVESLWVYPHSLSFFNALAGGPSGGPRHLASSNTDWGQDLLNLRRWLDDHPDARPLHLAYELPLVDPRLVGIEYLAVPGRPQPDATTQAGADDDARPSPGWYALGVNQIHARERRFDYFLELTPAARAGYSILIYRVSEQDAERLRGKLGAPRRPADPPPR